MKIVASADWRDGLEYDIPVLVSDVIPGEPTKCFACGTESPLRERDELWAVKHRHPKNHDGFVRFYCIRHVPPLPVAPSAPAPAPARARRAPAAPRAERTIAPRRTQDFDRVRAMCPNCFVEISAAGECGMCGWSAA